MAINKLKRTPPGRKHGLSPKETDAELLTRLMDEQLHRTGNYCWSCRTFKPGTEEYFHRPPSGFLSSKCNICTRAQQLREISRRIGRSIAGSMYRAIHENKGGESWENLVDYTLQELKDHLEKQFQVGMSWDNYGEWHIDHIRPIASYNIQTITDKDFKLCWSLDNLQPLWALDNIRKGARYSAQDRHTCPCERIGSPQGHFYIPAYP